MGQSVLPKIQGIEAVNLFSKKLQQGKAHDSSGC